MTVRVRSALPAFAAVALAAGLAAWGLSSQAMVGPASFLHALLTAGLGAALFLLACFGIGAAILPRALGDAPNRLWSKSLALALGVCVMSFLAHAMGSLGLFAGAKAQLFALAPIIVGLALALKYGLDLKRPPNDRPTGGAWIWLMVAPGAVLMVAAASPPGWLWDSEARGFDALSYHLPLAIEWASPQIGALKPLAHNVYSYLPSGMEAVFLQVHAAMGGAIGGIGSGPGLLSIDGVGLVLCQFIHAGCALLAAMLSGQLVFAVTGATTRRGAYWIAAGAAISTPWIVVTGSLAYNECAAAAGVAAAMIVALNTSIPAARRGVLAGFILGCACAFKGTALFVAGPAVGLVALLSVWREASPTPALRRATFVLLMMGVGGFIALAPAAARNYAAGGNPIFPAGTGIFGAAHWSDEQVARFKAAHGPQVGLVRGAELLLSPTGDPASVDRQPRGVWHEHFGILWPVAVAAGVLALFIGPRRNRALALTLWAGVAIGLVWWCGFSHQQARFLVPLVPVLAMLIGLCAQALFELHTPSDDAERDPLDHAAVRGYARIGLALLIATPALNGAIELRAFTGQSRGSPNALLAAGVGEFTGSNLAPDLRTAASPDELRQRFDSMPVTAFVNLGFGDDPISRKAYTATYLDEDSFTGLYAIGVGTPLYYRVPLLWHTVWDASPLGDAIRKYPNAPARWTQHVQTVAQDRLGVNISHVLIDLDELDRYRRTYGYDPAVTKQALDEWLARECLLVKTFDRDGRATMALFRIAGTIKP